MSGFYAGDLRNLKFHYKEYPPDISYTKMFAKEKEFGIMDIAG